MYKLTEIEAQGLSYLEMVSPCGTSKAEICLDQGGRLNNLVFKGVQILAKYDTNIYKDNYASSILFPFANRIKNGEYTFNNTSYKLHCNEVEKNNALHGLVYNKKFTCINKGITSDYSTVTLQYKDPGRTKGFPFKFSIELTYTLNQNGIILSIKVLNRDKKAFPFSLGWHPYFNSKNLDKSSINFHSNTKYVCDNQQIISSTTHLDVVMPYKLKGAKLDDGYKLKTNEIDFLTPDYGINIKSTSQENFLQLYTPNGRNIIAIEPMTGAADSFNNEIGLQTLRPNETFSVKWLMAIETFNNKMNSNKLIDKLCNS